MKPEHSPRFPLAFWVSLAVKAWVAVIFLAAAYFIFDALNFLSSLPAGD